jgi:hypothetical protein
MMREVADNIALLHKLVGEVNVVISRLAAAGIHCGIRTGFSSADPLSPTTTIIRIELELQARLKDDDGRP